MMGIFSIRWVYQDACVCAWILVGTLHRLLLLTLISSATAAPQWLVNPQFSPYGFLPYSLHNAPSGDLPAQGRLLTTSSVSSHSFSLPSIFAPDRHPGHEHHLRVRRGNCVHGDGNREVWPVHHRCRQVFHLPGRRWHRREQGVQDLRAGHLHHRRLRCCQTGHGDVPVLHDQRVPCVRYQHLVHCQGNGDRQDRGVRDVHCCVQRRRHFDRLHQCCHVIVCSLYVYFKGELWHLRYKCTLLFLGGVPLCFVQ